jgi:hypothetical protein
MLAACSVHLIEMLPAVAYRQLPPTSIKLCRVPHTPSVPWCKVYSYLRKILKSRVYSVASHSSRQFFRDLNLITFPYLMQTILLSHVNYSGGNLAQNSTRSFLICVPLTIHPIFWKGRSTCFYSKFFNSSNKFYLKISKFSGCTSGARFVGCMSSSQDLGKWKLDWLVCWAPSMLWPA